MLLKLIISLLFFVPACISFRKSNLVRIYSIRLGYKSTSNTEAEQIQPLHSSINLNREMCKGCNRAKSGCFLSVNIIIY